MATVCEVLDARAVKRDRSAFARDVLEGLSRTPKAISSMYFYDAAGSRLFQRITELDEYYLTRCESEILDAHAGEIAALVRGGPFRLVELGVGDGHKTEILLRRFLDDGLNFEYAPIDVCRQTILGLTTSLGGIPGSLRVRAVVAEYFDGLAEISRQSPARNLVLFLGSSIGNFSYPSARRFLRTLRKSLQPGDYALIGFDLKKDAAVLQAAYDDSAGVTREFNLNLLDRINRELGGAFDRRTFRHHANYNVRQERMESWLISQCDQDVFVRDLCRSFRFRAYEGLHLECSHKYDTSRIEALAAASGFRVAQHFFDERRYFADSLWQAS